MPPDSFPFTEFSVHVAPSIEGGTHVAIFGEFDLATVAPVERALAKAIARDQDVIIDLRACEYVDSAGIAVLVKAALRLHDEERSLCIRGVRERVGKILDLAGIAGLAGVEIEAQEPRVPS